ncbi:hypothetical protein GXM_00617 [Nostoc sphaeroides CCNUC1]|uniref:Uncharacterized protein n=1 Tax=Nostoc sphaeroides CCNUC1 TaxID=2653204 RepID=A0A5P8VS61_9NOSO|nr:hypothetical protein GXM_00617 [Nostoc sphaeroides CCNUC1]
MLELHEVSYIVANHCSLETSVEGVFARGDNSCIQRKGHKHY